MENLFTGVTVVISATEVNKFVRASDNSLVGDRCPDRNAAINIIPYHEVVRDAILKQLVSVAGAPLNITLSKQKKNKKHHSFSMYCNDCSKIITAISEHIEHNKPLVIDVPAEHGPRPSCQFKKVTSKYQIKTTFYECFNEISDAFLCLTGLTSRRRSYSTSAAVVNDFDVLENIPEVAGDVEAEDGDGFPDDVELEAAAADAIEFEAAPVIAVETADAEVAELQVERPISVVQSSEGRIKELEEALAAEVAKNDALSRENAELKAQLEVTTTIKTRVVTELKKTQALLVESEEERIKLHDTVLDLKGKIRVVARLRPTVSSEAEKPLANIEFPTKNTLKLSSNVSYSFDHVFNPQTNQEKVFSYVKPLLQSVLDGFNVSLIAYGTYA